MVDTIRHYSNHPGLLEDLDQAVHQLERALAEPAHEQRSVRSAGRVGRLHAVRDRLSDDQVDALVTAFRAGTTKHVLGTQYGISPKSVQRLLRQHEKDERHVK